MFVHGTSGVGGLTTVVVLSRGLYHNCGQMTVIYLSTTTPQSNKVCGSMSVDI